MDVQTHHLKLVSENRPLHLLEIGSYEGASTTFFIDNFMDHDDASIVSIDPFCNDDKNSPVSDDTKRNFVHNISMTKYPDKHTLIQKFSYQALPDLILERHKYNYILVDGSHETADVLNDALLVYHLLEPRGILFFDDYDFFSTATTTTNVRKGIDRFLEIYGHEFDTLWENYHLVLQKK